MAKVNFFGLSTVKNQKIDLEIPIIPFAFDGSRTYSISLRTGSFSGPVLYQPPVVTVVDNARIIDFSPNTFSTVEGREIEFYLLTANVADGSVIYYSVEPVSNNISLTEDFTFITPNIDITGNVIGNVILNYFNLRELVINDNQATFSVQANINSDLGSDDKIFRVGLYSYSNVLAFFAAEPDANVANIGFSFTRSPNVTIKDTTNFYNIVPSSFNIDHTQNATFTVNTIGVENGTNLYYFTTGIPTANTGIVSVTSNVATITFKPELPFDANTNFDIKLRLNDESGPLLSASPPVVGVGEKMRFMEMTGGDKFTLGNFTYHVFKSAGTLTVNKVGTIYNQVTISAVGGGGGGAMSSGSMGGGGGRVENVTRTFSQSDRNKVATVSVGSGGTGAFQSSTTSIFQSSGTPTSLNFSDSPALSVTALGGPFAQSSFPSNFPQGAGGNHLTLREADVPTAHGPISQMSLAPNPTNQVQYSINSGGPSVPVASFSFPGRIGGVGVPISPNFSPSEFVGAPPQVSTILTAPGPAGGSIWPTVRYGGGGGNHSPISPFYVQIIRRPDNFPGSDVRVSYLDTTRGGGDTGGLGGATSGNYPGFNSSSHPSGGYSGGFGGGGGGSGALWPGGPAPANAAGASGGNGGAGFLILKYRSND